MSLCLTIYDDIDYVTITENVIEEYLIQFGEFVFKRHDENRRPFGEWPSVFIMTFEDKLILCRESYCRLVDTSNWASGT